MVRFLLLALLAWLTFAALAVRTIGDGVERAKGGRTAAIEGVIG